jgi:hypothetical protein
MTDNPRDLLENLCLRKLIKSRITTTDKPLAQQQIFRGIATDRQFGNDQQVGIGFHRSLGRLKNELTIAGNVSDDGIDLGESNFHDDGPMSVE